MTYTFINRDDRYFVSNGEDVILLTEESFNHVRSMLSLPATVYFHNCSIIFIGEMVDKLFEESPDITIKKLDSEDGSLNYQASFEANKELSGKGLS